ncbi:Trichohyalin [Cronobacter universalis NCTC 9529]|nr:Trichohyalin [Cronobacter universalis NCTC 9529]
MNAGVEDARPTRVGHHRQRRAEQHQRRGDQNRQRGHFHFTHVDFLAEVFRRAANHQARDKHAQQHEQQHPVQSGADAAEDHFANLHQPHRDHAAERGKGVMHGVYRAAGSRRGDDRKQAARENAKAALFAFHIGGAVGAEREEVRVAGGFGPHHQRHADHENHRHGPENGAALARVAHRIAKGEAERRRDQKDSQHLYEIGQRGRVLKRMRGVGVKEAAAVGAEHFDRLLRRHRPHRQHLPRAFQRGERLVGREVLNRALLNKKQGDNQRNGHQHPQRDAGEILPGVAKCRRRLARKGADQRKRHRNAGRRREEVLHREARHLAEIADGAFTRVRLPVGIGDETHRRVERQMPGEPRQVLRVQRQHALAHQNGEQ